MTIFDRAFVRGNPNRIRVPSVGRRWVCARTQNVIVAPRRAHDRDDNLAAQGAVDTSMASRNEDLGSSLTPIVALAEKQSAKIIGVTSCEPNAGTSVVARKLAQAFAGFGRRVLLVDASRLEATPPNTERSRQSQTDYLSLNPSSDGHVDVIDLSTVLDWPVDAREDSRKALEAMARNSYTVIVDLPPIIQPTGKPTLVMASVGAACDVTYLVCLSGKTQKRPLKAAVEAAGIFGMKMGGVVLNDWKLPFSGILES